MGRGVPGPGAYYPNKEPTLNKTSYKISFASKYAITDPHKDVPGPASYEVKTANKMLNTSIKFSRSERITNPIKNNRSIEFPAPTSYNPIKDRIKHSIPKISYFLLVLVEILN